MSQSKQSSKQDLVIIGGGIMGLMTAYYASLLGKSITVIDKNTIPNKQAASFNFTRSMHIDYLDPLYSRLAWESRQLWCELESIASQKFIEHCGSFHLIKQSISPDMDQTYSTRSYLVTSGLGYGLEKLNSDDIKQRFPQFEGDVGYLEAGGGIFYQQLVAKWLIDTLRQRGVNLVENARVTDITERPDQIVEVKTEDSEYETGQLVITAGPGTNDLLRVTTSNKLTLPIRYEKPQERKYYYPPKDKIDQFMPDKLPVFAYLDVGIYGHPIFDRDRGAVKISYWRPPDFVPAKDERIESIEDFVCECLPALADSPNEDVDDADFCSYDYVDDDNFVIGRLPGFDRIYIGTGWRGTGYKFGPLVGKALAQLSLQQGTVYDISKFNLERFKND